MATIYPEFFPKADSENDPEKLVFNKLKSLPENYTIFYSKKFKGKFKTKEEAEIDFIIFDGSKNIICLEVKGGEIEYNGETNAWYQNGKKMEKSPDWQASNACHVLIDYLNAFSKKLNINWALAFPQSARPGGSNVISEVPNSLIIDERDFLEIDKSIDRIIEYNESQFNKPGTSRYEGRQVISTLLRSIGFVTKIGVRLASDAAQIFQVTDEQKDALDDLEINRRMLVEGFAGTGKTILAQEFAKRLGTRDKEVLLLFYNKFIAKKLGTHLKESPLSTAPLIIVLQKG